MIYTFSVINGYLNCTNARKTIISDMVNVHVAKFTLDSSWLGYDKTATFENTKTNVKKDIVLGTETLECLIPWESLVAESEGGYLVVGLTGYKDGKILRTKMFNPLLIEKSDIDDGDNPLPPTPDVYEQIMDLIASLGGAYVLPNASATTLGGIKVGTNLSIDLNGVLSASGGGTETSDYTLLTNKPSVNGVTLNGNKTSSDLGIDIPTKTSDLSNDSGFITSVPTATNSTKGIVQADGTTTTITNGIISAIGGSGGTSDYTLLSNKPSVNGVTLSGNKTGADLGITIPTKTSDLTNDSNFIIDADYTHTDNNYTDAEKTKLSGIASGAEVNVQSDWTAISGDALILNKPTIPSKTSDLTNDSNFVVDSNYVHTDTNYTQAEKTKLSNIAENANNYSLPTSSATVLGGIKIGTNLSIDGNGVVSASGGSGAVSSVNTKTGDVVLTTTDIADATNKRYVTDAQQTVIGNTSGTNTGDETNSTILSKIGYTPENIANKGQALGYCGLDGGSKVPLANLPATLLKYVGVWNASTNTPTLTNPDTTKIGNVYNVSVAGTQFGINFKLGDWLIYNESGVPEKSDNSDDVVSVNSKTGTVVLTTADIADSTDKKYVTDAEKTKLSNLSGTNSGNETTTTIGTLVNGAIAKTTAVDADMLPLMDSASSNVIKKFSWANLKATLKTYFDTIYSKGDIYVLAESVIGSYNGKPLYRKGITVASLPNATNTSYAHGASNVEYILRTYGATTDGTNFRPVPFVFASNIAASISLYATTTNIVIETATNRSALSGVFYIEYTKTTD